MMPQPIGKVTVAGAGATRHQKYPSNKPAKKATRPLSAAQLDQRRAAGRATAARLGRAHMAAIGRRGFDALAERFGHPGMARDFLVDRGRFRAAKALALAALLLTGATAHAAPDPDRSDPHHADAGIVILGRPVQFEYLPCLLDPDAVWFEDGSAANC